MIRNGSTAAPNLPTAVMDYDEVADWLPEDVAALSLHPVAYAPDAADGAVPIVTAAEFTRWTSARAANDRNGTWAGTVAEEGDTMEWTQDEYRLTEPPACFPLDMMTTDGTPCFRIVGMGMVRLTDALAAE